MRPARDLTNRRFGRLVALERAPNRGRFTRWRCQCDCGRTSIVITGSLVQGLTRSCGHHGGRLKSQGAARSHNGAAQTARRVNAEDAITQTFQSDPRALLKRLGIRWEQRREC